MMRQIGLNAKYLKGGISSWKWEFNESKLYKDISPQELKMLLDSFLNVKNSSSNNNRNYCFWMYESLMNLNNGT